MKFEFPFNYYAFFKRPRKPSWELCTMKSTSLATIREVDQLKPFMLLHLGALMKETHVFNLSSKNLAHMTCLFLRMLSIFRVSQRKILKPDSLIFKKALALLTRFSGHAPMKFPEDHYVKEAVVGWYDKDAPTTRAEAEKLIVKDETKKWLITETSS